MGHKFLLLGHFMFSVIRWVFYQLPSIAGILLATLSFAVVFMTKELETALKDKRYLKWSIVIVLCLIGVGGLVSDSIQKQEDKAELKSERDNARQDRTTLSRQVLQLISSAQIQATSDDIKHLSTDVVNGFDRVEAALKGIKPRKTAITTSAVPTAPASLSVTQRRAPSADAHFPYGLQVIIQTSTTIQPVGLRLCFDGPVGSATFFVAGESAFVGRLDGIHYPGECPNAYAFGFHFPAFTPEHPIVVTVLSASDIKLTSLEQIQLPF